MGQANGVVSPETSVNPWWATFAGLCASLVGVGLARFAYTPLIPVLIEAEWFGPSTVAYLGAANLAGYLAGALSAQWIAARVPSAVVLRAMMLLATVTFFASAVPVSFLWFFVWRFAAGLTGGVLMVLAATTVLAYVPPARRGIAGGAIFTGVGLGIAASGTLVPLLLEKGLAETWLGLGVLALVLTAVAWGGWPREVSRLPAAQPAAVPGELPRASVSLKALYCTYALCAVGLVPHMIFLVDFITRGLGHGVDIGARYWVLFGLGATVGSVLAGYLADRIGFARALRLMLLMQTAAVAVLTVWTGPIILAASSILIGTSIPGIVPLVLGRVLELTPPDGPARKIAWGNATTAFALGQAAAAYGFSYLFAHGGGYTIFFALGAAALVLALAADIVAGAMAKRQ
ncbi:MAG: YbfB/YjiJ family MFS transporter [Alphaproteobacteria bacterium]